MGSLAGMPLAAVSSSRRGSGHEVAALVPEGVPGRQRLGAARLLRVEWLLDAVAGGRILQAERRIRGGVDAAHQNTVDEQEEQHRHDEDAGGGGRRDREVPPPDESCRDPPHEFAQQPPHRDDRGAHEQAQTARTDVPVVVVPSAPISAASSRCHAAEYASITRLTTTHATVTTTRRPVDHGSGNGHHDRCRRK